MKSVNSIPPALAAPCLCANTSSAFANDAQTIDEAHKGRLQVTPRANSDLANFIATTAAALILGSKPRKMPQGYSHVPDLDSRHIDTSAEAMHACADRVESQMGNSGKEGHVREIESVSRMPSGWLLDGVIEIGMASDDRPALPTPFKCSITNGNPQAISITWN